MPAHDERPRPASTSTVRIRRDVIAQSSQDLEGDGVPNECQMPGDVDVDGEVDLADHTACIACLTGPNGGLPAGGPPFDLQTDADVDLADGAGFQNAFAGP